MTMTKTGVNPQLQTLLSITIKLTVGFSIVIFIILNVLGWLHQPDISETSDHYINVRTAAALKTFEYGVRISTGEEKKNPPVSTDDLLTGIPGCRDKWDDAPGTVARWVAHRKYGDKKLDFRSSAERISEKLVALNGYLVRQSSGGNRRLNQPVVLDASRWFDAARTALGMPIRVPLAEGGGVDLKLGCSDIAAAVKVLMPESCRQTLLESAGVDADKRMRSKCVALESLNWRDTSVTRVTSVFQPGQQIGIPASLIAQRNPWNGVPGCVYWNARDGDSRTLFYKSDSHKGNRNVCENEGVAGREAKGEGRSIVGATGNPADNLPLSDPRWSVPPSLDLILRPLDSLRLPGSSLYQVYTSREEREGQDPQRYGYGRNSADINGARLDVGFSIDLALDPTAQAFAQQIAACYTGAQQVCRKLGIRRAEDRGKSANASELPIGHLLQENAMVRMAGVAIIDIATGRIEAAAGALSPCARQENDGPGRGPECDKRLPWTPAYRPDLLENPAVFYEAMPASTVKPIMASAFLTDGAYGERLLRQEVLAQAAQPNRAPVGGLRYELLKSDSQGFLDRMFCSEKGFVDCQRPWHIQHTASAMGWNTSCADSASCGQRDILFGRSPDQTGESGQIVPSARMAMAGRMLAEPVSGRQGGGDWRFHTMPQRELDVASLKVCKEGKDGVVGRGTARKADDWQSCRAGYTGEVVHEGWGQGNARASALGVASMMAMLGAAANGATSFPAPHFIEGVRGTGTSASDSQLLTATQRFQLSQPLPVTIPKEAAQVIFGGLNWTHRGGTASSACEQLWGETACKQINWIAGKTGTPSFHNDGKKLDAIERECRAGKCSSLRPYKWYTGVFKTDNGQNWNKAIAVLTERNWFVGNGTVHGAGDKGPNPAAEIALLVARCLRDNPGGKDNAACRGD